MRASALAIRAPSMCTARPWRVRDVGELPDLVRAIDRAGFGRLRERQDRRTDMMRAAPLPLIERALQRRRRDLAGFAGKPDQLDAAAEEFRRAAFVGGDVRLVMAQHGAPGRREVRERERVRRGAGRHQEDRDLALKDLGECPLDPFGPVVVAVGQRGAVVGAGNGREDLRRDPGCVVACEVHDVFLSDGRGATARSCGERSLGDKRAQPRASRRSRR